MTPHDRLRPHTTTSDRARRRLALRPRRPSVQLISDGVTAGYIHEISQRHHAFAAGGVWQRRPDDK